MVFSTTNLFKGIPCPEGEKCALTSCIFAHELRPQPAQAPAAVSGAIPGDNSTGRETRPEAEPPAKRRRVTYDKVEDKPASKADLIRSQIAKDKQSPNVDRKSGSPRPGAPLASLKRSVSPPTKTNGVSVATSSSSNSNAQLQGAKPSSGATATLNPRIIAHDPAGHAKRSLLLKHLHAEMVRLNKALVERQSQGLQFPRGIVLLDGELVELAVNEEEKVAKEQSGKAGVYGNVIKNLIARFKKMSSDGWIQYLKGTELFKGKQKSIAPHPGTPKLDAPKVISTDLNPDEEAAILPHLTIRDQTPLAQFGYIPTPPTTEQATEAAAAIEASKNYEVCDRCSARFQVFPERNEEGLLTSNGTCRHHPMRKQFPQKSKADLGPKEPYYPCCNEVVGSAGCTILPNHVFKASSPARLAAVLPFSTTPQNESPAKDRRGKSVKAVAFDCEMGYTTLGMEVIRLTAVGWPDGIELVDVLVRPLGIVLDLNSRFSGVRPEDMANAIPHSDFMRRSPQRPPAPPDQLDDSADSSPPPLPIVDSPAKARELLCSFLTPQTPLIGHAIDNDLNVVRLCHPTIIDTVILFSHPRGLPMRYGLRMLSSKHLQRQIQQGGERGHDSLEDARATGDLVRVKVGEKWKVLRATGWTMVQGQLVPPPPMKDGKREAANESDGGLANGLVERAISGDVKKKRKRSEDSKEEEANGLMAFLGRGKSGGNDVGDGGGEHVMSVAYLEDDEKKGGLGKSG